MKRETTRTVDIPAHVARQYLGNLGKIDTGVVSVTSLWADEQVYSPVEIEPYTQDELLCQREERSWMRAPSGSDRVATCPTGAKVRVAFARNGG
jgi:hypothetical protein